MLVFQPCTFHIIFIILCFLLAIENLPMKKILFRFKSGLYLIMYVCLSISAQLFCNIKLMSFWVHPNVGTNCVTVTNLAWPYMFQYTTTNYASGRIVVTRKFPNPDLIGPVDYSWRYMISSLLPSEWTLHCVYLM